MVRENAVRAASAGLLSKIMTIGMSRLVTRSKNEACARENRRTLSVRCCRVRTLLPCGCSRRERWCIMLWLNCMLWLKCMLCCIMAIMKKRAATLCCQKSATCHGGVRRRNS